jgi:hypothetical protein
MKTNQKLLFLESFKTVHLSHDPDVCTPYFMKFLSRFKSLQQENCEILTCVVDIVMGYYKFKKYLPFIKHLTSFISNVMCMENQSIAHIRITNHECFAFYVEKISKMQIYNTAFLIDKIAKVKCSYGDFSPDWIPSKHVDKLWRLLFKTGEGRWKNEITSLLITLLQNYKQIPGICFKHWQSEEKLIKGQNHVLSLLLSAKK